MGENSKIEWCDHTWNPWIGCTRVSPGCVNCYAESFARRYAKAEWGPQARRLRTSAANWRKPLAWNAKAEREDRRFKVFCASLADVFERNEQVVRWRSELLDMILDTPNLDWLLLTKRPENISDMVFPSWFSDGWPANLWIGASVETQEVADERIPELLKIPAPVRFLSCEPLLGPINLFAWLGCCPCCGAPRRDSPYIGCSYCDTFPDVRGVQWVIAGGESGPQARPMHQDWARGLRDQCQEAEVPFFFKQWGQYIPVGQTDKPWYNAGELMLAADKVTPVQAIRLASKSAAGRMLDGREWNEMPEGKK